MVAPGNPERATWRDLPGEVVAAVEEHLGGAVVDAGTVTTGFSPGYAGTVTIADGRRSFIKAADGAVHPESARLNRLEAQVNAALPSGLPAPAFAWAADVGDWIVTCFEAVGGAPPAEPWDAHELARVMDAIGGIAAHSAPPGLPPFEEAGAEVLTRWSELAALAPRERADFAAPASALGIWALDRLDALLELEAAAPSAVSGDALVHGDIRGDNVLIDGSKVWIVDWPYACSGAPWLDLVAFLPSVEMQGGGACAALFESHPVAARATGADIAAAVAAVAGYFLVQSCKPAPPGIPTLRAFQLAQAGPAIRWLTSLEPSLR